LRQVTTLVPENHATAAAISDNGGLIAYANIDGIFIKATGGETTALQSPADFVVDQLAWFADGTKLVANGFSSTTYVPAIWTVSVTGGRANQLRLHTRAGVPSPDGMWMNCAAALSDGRLLFLRWAPPSFNYGK
jgi:hypothetical protein